MPGALVMAAPQRPQGERHRLDARLSCLGLLWCCPLISHFPGAAASAAAVPSKPAPLLVAQAHPSPLLRSGG